MTTATADLQQLDALLRDRTYIEAGATPTAADFEAFSKMSKVRVRGFAHAARFYQHMSSYSPADKHRVLGSKIGVGDPGSSSKKAAKRAAKEAKLQAKAKNKKAPPAPKKKPAAPAPKKKPPVERPPMPDLSASDRAPQKPSQGATSILITSALPYVNNEPHLGNIIGCVLSADVYARYCRLKGKNTMFVCGTDEYGTATETKAFESNMTPKEICDKYHVIHRDIYKWFNIAFDYFGRTSTDHQTYVAQHIFKRIEDHDMLEEQENEQLYCPKHDKYLADRYVEGPCPKCGFDGARGDQCDKCGSLLDPTELINAHYKYDATAEITKKKTKHLYLNLPLLEERLNAWVNEQGEGKWSDNTKKVTHSWLRDGLKPRCITRDLKWGTRVPREGYEKKVFYVWFDAPIGYISITKDFCSRVEGSGTWEDWWRAPIGMDGKPDVSLVQFMGKDNIPFHTVIFPSSLIATGDPWTMLDRISTTEYLNYDGGKFSKSNSRGVFGSNCADTGISADVWRYYLLSNRPESSDSDFSWKAFQLSNNSELLANLGNFCNRALSFTNKQFGGKVPDSQVEAAASGKAKELALQVDKELQAYGDLMDRQQIREGARAIMRVSSLGNGYLQEQKPWEMLKNGDTASAAVVLGTCVQLVHYLSIMCYPYMPGVSYYLTYQLGGKPLIPSEKEDPTFGGVGMRWKWEAPPLEAGRVLPTPFTIFDRMEDETVELWMSKYGSKEAALKQFDVELRVGKVVSVDNHPNPDADKLYLLKVSLGEHGERQVVAGLKASYKSAADLMDKTVVVVCNLEVAKIKDVESQGMVLVADKKGLMGLLTVDRVALGTQILPDQYTFAGNGLTVSLKAFKSIGIKSSNGAIVLGDTPLLAGSTPIFAERVGQSMCPVR